MNKRQLGLIYENEALGFLESKGFNFIQKNFFCKKGEIDLILKDKDFIVFVEVKSIKNNSFNNIYSLLTKSKKLHLKKSINYWLLQNNLLNSAWRFDYIAIVKSPSGFEINHFEFVSLD